MWFCDHDFLLETSSSAFDVNLLYLQSRQGDEPHRQAWVGGCSMEFVSQGTFCWSCGFPFFFVERARLQHMGEGIIGMRPKHVHISKNIQVTDQTACIYLQCTTVRFNVPVRLREKQNVLKTTYLLTYVLPEMPLACRAATKVLHFCLSLAAIFSIVPQELYIDLSSPSTVRIHVLFRLQRLRFPAGVQCSAVQ